MKYLAEAIPRTLGELKARISDTMLRAPTRKFPATYDFDGTFCSMTRGVDNLREKLGAIKAEQAKDMLAQAKAHYEAKENRLGGALMEDTKMLIMSRQPWAYPKELYRWQIDPDYRELSEADLREKSE